ncbi:hypothetical protein VAE151_520155 [Vibrio aestuarianus]|uniref:Uncharacterized protein n=1 Tax=Vibrio aestuarianus TaxID=28171 RepID=A0ABM9FMR1_9VIBR|nr:hypothetical protein VAE055_340158 [Vibrio aestuarianus]CAH8185839.1 hypothetical protein VAE128_440159 [Vibrio aestuarianus]CAH8185886.1 hypothetical protein VAE130_550159 [Vibrio aestuarianus]CAH8186062.1 hypothetical protein VAE115_290160 [Vibrio aestuarianus]CAH8192312.1 hypothetical protein VAE142_870158 [Vibrio aestuarianus]
MNEWKGRIKAIPENLKVIYPVVKVKANSLMGLVNDPKDAL